MFKKIFFQIHWFLGITAGLILSIVGVTGAIYSYDQEILKWINADSYQVSVAAQDKLSPNEIFLHFKQTQPEMQINSISIEHDPVASSSINIVKEGARRGYTMMINPYTAEVLPEIKGRDFFQFIMQLHRWLTVGDVGKQIVGASTLMLIFFVLSGIYLRWPKKHSIKQWFAVKPKLNGRNFIWDLHAVIGTWMAILYLIMAITGLYWSYDWWRSGMFKVMGVAPPQSQNAPPKPAVNSNDKNANAAQRQNNRAEGGKKSDSLSTEDISLALNLSWSGVHAQLGREYSSITLNLPKKADGMMDISFVDAIPQHERARNTLSFNYQQQKIEEIKLYQDKKLNEKIMSSMLPVHRGSFFGPVVQFIFMVSSLIMPLFFVTGWMLYLKRRKQKKLTQLAKQSRSVVQTHANAKSWIVCYASQTGVAEQVAWRTATSLQQAQQNAQVIALQTLSAHDLKHAKHVLFIASTFGTGEAPDLAVIFENKIMSKPLDLQHLQFAVLALGSMEYAESYCSFGHRLYDWLSSNGAQALFKTIEVNNGSNDDIQRWNTALTQVTQLELQDMHVEKAFDCYILRQREILNPNSLGAPAYNIELEAPENVLWHAGDIAEIQCMNSQQQINAFIQQHNLDAQSIVSATTQTLQQYLTDKDLTQNTQTSIDTETLLAQLPVLATREYSIASIVTEKVLRLVVRLHSTPQGQLGLGSGWLAEHSQLNDSIRMRIRTNPAFHLIDDNRPIICIGNGTGIAGLMSLLQTRMQHGYHDNWLIFGERQRAHDYFYQDTLEHWHAAQKLTHLDLAFSRDQAEKHYVHHVMRARAEQLKTWIAQGAVIYVCGSIQGMATDVEQALVDILGEETVDQLRLEQRYRRDVY